VSGISIALEDVTVSFGGVKALTSVTAQFMPSEIVALVGENGSGKTTLLNAISGIVRSTGRISLNGIDVTEMNPWSRARLGICRSFQKPRFFPRLAVGEDLQISSVVRRAPHSAALYFRILSTFSFLFQFVTLSAMSDRRHGTERMHELNRIEVANPTVVLLDEPFGGLMRWECVVLSARIKALAARGATIIIVEHRHDLVLPLANSVLQLSEGRVVHRGAAH